MQSSSTDSILDRALALTLAALGDSRRLPLVALVGWVDFVERVVLNLTELEAVLLTGLDNGLLLLDADGVSITQTGRGFIPGTDGLFPADEATVIAARLRARGIRVQPGADVPPARRTAIRDLARPALAAYASRVIESPTRALRARSAEALRSELGRLLSEGESEWVKDDRDLMMALAPFHDCATRLGLEPAAVFDDVAASAPESLARLVRIFGRRSDITPDAFAFAVVRLPEGPAYTWQR